jgi:uncharacterized membrane protein YfcA
MFGVGNVIGVVSSLVGIGGGTLSVPFMIWCNMPVHHAIGTSAAIGFPSPLPAPSAISLMGGPSRICPNSQWDTSICRHCLGIVVTSVLTAPLGVRLAHSLPVDRLKRVFAILLLVVGTRMLIGIL